MTDQATSSISSAVSLRNWYRTPIGQSYQLSEAGLLSAALSANFRSSVLQIDQIGWEGEFHQAMRFAHYTIVDLHLDLDNKYAHVMGLADAIPIDTHSIDIVILPHTLEFNENPHQVLREVNRVLKPEGIVMLLGFNPWSLWHLPRFLPKAKDTVPWNGKFISRSRVIDWLKLLNFKVEKNHGCCFLPVAKYQSSSKLHLCLDKIGKYLPFLPAAYFVMGVKRVSGPTSVFNLSDLKKRFIPPLTKTASSRVDVKKTNKNSH